MKKRRQHYVWKHYLDGWTIDGKLWCKRGSSLFQTSTLNVGNQRDFYRVGELSLDDIHFVHQSLVVDSHPVVRRVMEKIIQQYSGHKSRRVDPEFADILVLG